MATSRSAEASPDQDTLRSSILFSINLTCRHSTTVLTVAFLCKIHPPTSLSFASPSSCLTSHVHWRALSLAFLLSRASATPHFLARLAKRGELVQSTQCLVGAVSQDFAISALCPRGGAACGVPVSVLSTPPRHQLKLDAMWDKRRSVSCMSWHTSKLPLVDGSMVVAN